MIISHVLGGIGNQMFQYAAARALSAVTEQPLLLDVGDFSEYRLHHGYELSRVFTVAAKSVDLKFVREILGWRASPFARRLLRRKAFAWFRGSRYVVEPHFQFWAGFHGLTHDCYLSGYWQSERYFKACADTIRNDFTFRAPLSGRNQELASEMGTRHSVSLHVRRGDYVTDRRTKRIMAACSEVYYRKAMVLIAERIENPVFYVFSDDIAWAKQNLPKDYPLVFIEHNSGTESYKDMQLMSRCRHHIIANSSFSWWGAWLNRRDDKIVVAPSKWFSKPVDTTDLIPREWQVL